MLEYDPNRLQVGPFHPIGMERHRKETRITVNKSAIRNAVVVALAVGAIGGGLIGTSAAAQAPNAQPVAISAQASYTSHAAAAITTMLRDTDKPLINGTQADFGTGGLNVAASRQPNSPGTLTFHQSVATPGNPSVITARLTGQVYWDDLFAGGCARVKMSLYNTTGEQAPGSPIYSARACQIGGSLTPPSKLVDLSLGSINAHRVVVTTQIGANASTPSGDYKDTKSQTWHYGQVPQD